MKKQLVIFAFVFGFAADGLAQSEPPYGMSELEAYSIFFSNYQQGDYQMALQFGRWMIESNTRNIEGAGQFDLSRQYDRMIKVYAGLAEQQSDPSLRSAYIDSALVLFERVYEVFDEDEIDVFDWKFEEGRFYQNNASNISGGMDRAYELYAEAFEMSPEKLAGLGNGYYVQILLNNYVTKRERDNAMAMIEKVEPYANDNIQGAIDQAFDRLFDSPGERIGLIESRLADDPNNIELLTELATLHDRAGNRDKSIEVARKLYELQPTFDNAKTLADFASSNAQYNEAIRFLKEALELTDNNTQKRNVNLEIAETYQNVNDLRNARQHARAASQLDRSWGQPYIRLAQIYASSVSQCTQNEGRTIDRDDRVVYWLVLDYLDRARNADSSVENTVRRLYETYTPVLPTVQDKFFRDWETGESIRVDGSLRECYAWINETTTIR
ncbi:MAG: tetratricopeptide repeat protein [Balneolaceae bacterium]